jgi:hypothetical protein
MKNKTGKTPSKGVLVHGELIPITDPGEQAAVNRRFEEVERILADQAQPKNKWPRRKK